LDTLKNLEAMQSDMFIVRHSDSGAAALYCLNTGTPMLPSLMRVMATCSSNASDVRYVDEFVVTQAALMDSNCDRGDILHSTRCGRSQLTAATNVRR